MKRFLFPHPVYGFHEAVEGLNINIDTKKATLSGL